MLEPAIEAFFFERKATWLKDKLKTCKTEAEQQDVESKANEKFLLANWLPDAAKRAGQLSMVSHPGKFSHPSAKISSVIANSKQQHDGFLRTGNAVSEFDFFGNAAALDVHKFLSLSLIDGQTVLAHLEQESEHIKSQFKSPEFSFTEIRLGLLAIKKQEITDKTSEKIKQVYFPVDKEYHLLSILTPSGLMFKLKQHINTIRFSEAAKQAREDRRNQHHNQEGYDEIYNLTVIGFGGTKPQNISVLNNQYGGTTYLLPSLPPQLKPRDIPTPKSSFFVNSLYYKNYQDSFQALHRLLKVDYNNINIRQGCDNSITHIVKQVIEQAWIVRQLPEGWSKSTALKTHQKIWLDEAYNETRENEDDWLDDVITDFARWIVFTYEKTVGKEQSLLPGDDEFAHIKRVIAGVKENLR